MWQKIETAPKDGNWIIASPSSLFGLPGEPVRWSKFRGGCWIDMDGLLFCLDTSNRLRYWMPLQPQPEAE